jgi:soluble lytic murein transglycosylase-like protein
MLKLHLLLCLICFCSLSANAGTIERIENPDGSVEFSNQSVSPPKQITTIYKSQTGQGMVFSDQKPQHGQYEILEFACYACNPDSKINWHTIRLNTQSYAKEVARIAHKHHVDPALVRAVIHAESAFNAKALSKKGAQGLMQLMPATAKDLGVSNAFNPTENIEGGVKYLAWLLKEFKGDTQLTAAAYNAGPNAVKRYNGIPPYAETKVYVERVNILFKRYQQVS